MSRRIQDGPSVNETLVITNRISIVADAYAYEHFANIRYVKWGGALGQSLRWKFRGPVSFYRWGDLQWTPGWP